MAGAAGCRCGQVAGCGRGRGSGCKPEHPAAMSSDRILYQRPSRQRPPVPTDDTGLFSRADALAAGWTDAALEHAVRCGRLVRVRRGVFTAAAPASVTPAERGDQTVLRLARATARMCGRAALSHSPAALGLCLPVVGRARACLTVPAGTALRDLADVHLHRAGLPPEHLVSVDGFMSTHAGRTVLDLAREHGLTSGVAAADAALRRGLTSRQDLEDVIAFCAHWPRISVARRVLELADPLAESPLESVSRVAMHAAGLPAPVLQAELGDEYGFFIARCDFYWPEFGVVGEVDGRAKYRQGSVVIAEHEEAALRELGLQVVRWDAWQAQYFDMPARRLRTAFGRGVPVGKRRWSWLNDPCLRIAG